MLWNPDSGIWEIFACGLRVREIFLVESKILDFGIQNSALGIRIPLTIGIQNPSSTDKGSWYQYLESIPFNPLTKSSLQASTVLYWKQVHRLHSPPGGILIGVCISGWGPELNKLGILPVGGPISRIMGGLPPGGGWNGIGGLGGIPPWSGGGPWPSRGWWKKKPFKWKCYRLQSNLH